MRIVKPIKSKDVYSKAIARAIEESLYWFIYYPLLSELVGDTEMEVKENAKTTEIIRDLKRGVIFYVDGYILGKLRSGVTSEIRKLGGTFDKRKKGYKISLSLLPPEVRSMLAQQTMYEKARLEKMKLKLEGLSDKDLEALNIKPFIAEVLTDLDAQFKRVTPRDLEIKMEMSPEIQQRLLEDYFQNTQLSIRNFSQEAIERLRKKVGGSVAQGYRADKLAKVIMSEKNVSAKRAKFIALQETSLLVSKFRQTRYEGAGVNKYKWSTSKDRRVRDSHRELDGRIFDWDNPPIVDSATGRKAHPGEDFRCRCVPLPVLEI